MSSGTNQVKSFTLTRAIAFNGSLEAWFTKMNRRVPKNKMMKKKTSALHHVHLLSNYYNWSYMLIILLMFPYHRKSLGLVPLDLFALRGRFHLTDWNWEVGFDPCWYLCPLLTISGCHLCCPDLSDKTLKSFSPHTVCNINKLLVKGVTANSTFSRRYGPYRTSGAMWRDASVFC